MKKHSYLLMAGIALTCSLSLSACHSQGEKKPNQPSKHLKSKKVDAKKKSKTSQKKQKGVAGVDYPTDDGFMLSKQSKILSKTDSGIVVEHDGHSHFIFYKDLKGSQFAYLIPEGANLSKPMVTAEASSNHGSGHHYVFNPADIVAEDAQGYTVRHGDHFHYILKSSLGMSVSPSTNMQVQAQHNFVRNVNYTPQGSGISGLDFATSDGFKFDGKEIVGQTKDSILVNHNGHLHPITFNDLRQSGWGEIADYYESQSKGDKKNTPKDALEEEFKAKLDYLAKELGLSTDLIKRIETKDGKLGLEYPHGDHSHVLMLTDFEIGKAIPDPHDLYHARQLEKHKIGMQTLKNMGFDDEVVLDIVRTHMAATDFPSNETNPKAMEKWLASVTKVDLGSRKNPLKRFGLSYLPNLEALGIGFTPIDDMTPVLQFKKLKQLLMTATGVKNYDFLSQMPMLESIDVSQNGLDDLSFLVPYKKLNLVAAADNNLKTLAPLAELPNLQFLVLSNNQISDLSPLASLSKIQEIHIENNKLSNLNALTGKESLKILNLSENKGFDADSLKLPNLEMLTLEKVDLKSLDFIKNNPSLTELTVSHNQLKQLDGIEGHKRLVNLKAESNQLQTIKLPHKQESLKYLNVSKNELKDLEGVNDYQKLETLRAATNKLTSLKLKEANHQVTSLDVSDNNIPLEELKQPQENAIPIVIAQNFPSVREGSAADNGTAEEKAKRATDAESASHEELEHSEDDHHNHEHHHHDEDEHDHDH
ncbi:leucine-rich repeat domain-containing protein [Streptococcus iniae]|uniref:Internalin n=1 Tax=Streptococcus iniae TaxID=1346 RepID=A0A3L8GIP0_STRIN|nr:pneumococcal-type histidine triad protein [Streptococcus iniae]AGM98439.1 leucine rich repeat protein [Streptococcus iniae SF1]AHY15482.1 internalin [Streptococcus iniae]AHY17350.1 internalin [Streptococcus iniae]AJG25654.1 internalin [Streptococcus iniae]APD31524.1 internalin [Streptococcus iniae]